MYERGYRHDFANDVERERMRRYNAVARSMGISDGLTHHQRHTQNPDSRGTQGAAARQKWIAFWEKTRKPGSKTRHADSLWGKPFDSRLYPFHSVMVPLLKQGGLYDHWEHIRDIEDQIRRKQDMGHSSVAFFYGIKDWIFWDFFRRNHSEDMEDWQETVDAAMSFLVWMRH